MREEFKKEDRVVFTPSGHRGQEDNSEWGKVWPCNYESTWGNKGKISCMIEGERFYYVKFYNEKGNMKRRTELVCGARLSLIKQPNSDDRFTLGKK